MIVTPLGRQFLNQSEFEILNLNMDSREFLTRTKSLSSTSLVSRFHRIVIKNGSPLSIKHEVNMLMKLSSISPIFPPVLAYGEEFFSYPYIDGIVLYDSGASLDFIRSMSDHIAEVTMRARILPRDLHSENLILTATSFHVIDVEKYIPMDRNSRISTPQLASYIYDELTKDYFEEDK